MRNKDPKSGFGVRVQKGILQKIPIVDIGLRAHFSYFSGENDISRKGLTYSTDMTEYDFGLAAMGGISLACCLLMQGLV